MAKEFVICDTDVLIDYWNSHSPRHSTTKYILEDLIELDNVMLSSMTKMELIMGAGNKSELNRINKNIHQFQIAIINENITLSATQLLQAYKLSHGLAIPDAFIAATAAILKMKLFTYNAKDYKFINGLELYMP